SLLRGSEASRRSPALEREASVRSADLDAAAVEREVETAVEGGRFAEAARLLYLATLLRLRAGRDGVLELSRTPGEHLRGFRRAPFFDRLREFVVDYQRLSFGGRAVDREGWRRFLSLRPAEARP
ncbi:MAG: hypothetical protein ACREIU_13215, partial [Planctomycetota bacterium]